MNRILFLCACVAAVTCNDIEVGSVDHGRVVFDEKIQASPAIWRQVQKITVNASDYEVISRVVITDERPEKDGDAKIIEGGEGYKNVTVELQSPTVFRGFDFHVVVYAIQDRVDRQHPILISKDTDVNVPSVQKNDESVDVIPESKPTATDDKKVSDESKPSTPTTDDQTRNYRNTDDLLIDPIVKYVNEDKTVEVPASIPKNSDEKKTGEVTSKSVEESNAPITSPTIEGEENDDQINEDGSDYVKLSAKDVPKESNNDMNVQPTVKSSTETSDIIISSTENQTTQQNFDSISKELGQKVLYGIKKH